jgi:hypothetical protein
MENTGETWLSSITLKPLRDLLLAYLQDEDLSPKLRNENAIDPQEAAQVSCG